MPIISNTKSQNRCSYCHGLGHNKTTCPTYKARIEEWRETYGDEHPWVAAYDKKKAKKKGEDMDPENHPFFGKMYIETSSKFKPGQVGPDRKALEGGTIIMSGDIIKFSALVKPYEAFEGGVSLQLRNVQLIEKMSGAGDPSDDFDDETDGHDGSDADDDTDF